MTTININESKAVIAGTAGIGAGLGLNTANYLNNESLQRRRTPDETAKAARLRKSSDRLQGMISDSDFGEEGTPISKSALRKLNNANKAYSQAYDYDRYIEDKYAMPGLVPALTLGGALAGGGLAYSLYKPAAKVGFSKISGYYYFSAPSSNPLAVGGLAAAGGLTGVVGAAIYNRAKVGSSMTDAEAARADRLADRFSSAYDEMAQQNPSGFYVQAGKGDKVADRYVRDAQAFLDNDQTMRDKYSSKWAAPVAIGGGAIAGGLLAHKYLR